MTLVLDKSPAVRALFIDGVTIINILKLNAAYKPLQNLLGLFREHISPISHESNEEYTETGYSLGPIF